MASTGFLTEGGGLLRILYVGTRNTIERLESAAFTKLNKGAPGTQLGGNTTLADVNKLGCLAGSVAAVKGEGVVGAGTGPADAIVGLFVNDVAGNAYESSSAASSGKGVYVHNMGVYEVGVFETMATDGATSILANYQYGKKLYCSANGFLTVEEGLAGGAAAPGDVVIGIITKAPTANDMVMRFNLRM